MIPIVEPVTNGWWWRQSFSRKLQKVKNEIAESQDERSFEDYLNEVYGIALKKEPIFGGISGYNISSETKYTLFLLKFSS